MLNKRFLPLSICVAAFFIWCILLFYKYDHFGYSDWDLAFYTQACWQLLHGSQFSSIAGINYFGNHSCFITFLTLPFFVLAPHPLTLVLLKLMSFLIAAYLFYKIANEALGQRTALALMILYILFPANIFSLLYEFSPESFAPPVLFWMFMAFDKRQWKSFLTACVFLMLIKENMPLIVCAFGLYGLFRKDCPPKIAWFTLFLGAAAFIILVIYAIPYFYHLTYHPFVVRYAYLGRSVGEIIFNMFTHPQKIIKVVFDPSNGSYIQELFGPLLVPALFSVQLLFLVFPILLQHLLSAKLEEHSIYYYYGATIAPFIFLAVMRTLSWCYRKFHRRGFNAILFLLIFLSIANLYGYFNLFSSEFKPYRNRLDVVRWAMVDAIPAKAGVVATFDFLAPLSLREHLYSFHKVYTEVYLDPKQIKSSELNTGKPFVLPDQVHYAIIDFNDDWLRRSLFLKPQATLKRMQTLLEKGDWKVIKRYGSVVLLKR